MNESFRAGTGLVAGPSALYVVPSPDGQKLRIGLLLDSLTVPAWVAHIVAEIQNSGFAGVELVVLNAEQSVRPPFFTRLRKRVHYLLYDIYVRRDVRRRRAADSPFRTQDLAGRLSGVPVMRAQPRRSGAVHRFRARDIKRIAEARLDVLLRFGFNIIRGEILNAAREGVWSYHHGDSDAYRGGPPLFWEMYEGNPVSGVVLQRLTDKLDGGGVLFRSYGATHPHSLELNRDATYRKASDFVMRCLRGIALDKPPLPELSASATYAKSIYRKPGNLQMLRFLGHTTARKTRALIDGRRRVPRWSVAWRRGHLVDPANPDPAGMREISCPRGHFYADPFLFHHEREDWLFVEDYDYSRGKAGISVLRWGQHGPAGVADLVLDLPVHLSYPCVFGWEGQVYMIPETGEADRISLFRARAFPDEWEFVRDLLSGRRAVDATMHQHAGRWYLFVNIDESGGGSLDELFLFHADTPYGPFHPHPANPIVSDVRSARPGGRLFERNGRLIRPSQDSARGYGHSLVFNEVLELDGKHYAERVLSRLAPWGDGVTGCHTYATVGDLEIIDVQRRPLRRVAGA
ncbi:MAG: hypothetical protein V4567_02975 [Pseudomonadota bacterium]